MRKLFVMLGITLLIPLKVSALTCSAPGHTVVYINGIFAQSQIDAGNQRKNLVQEYEKYSVKTDVNFVSGYNPSHLGGAGDLLQSVTQAFNKPVSDYDMKTILMQIHPQVTTRKILLVGHSQGTFYTNELYKYLISHGVPKESIGVYNIATPASYVAGGGWYVTSTNDKLINYVRDLQINGNVAVNANSFYTIGSVVASSLRANITVPPEADYESSKFGGHKLSVYLDGAAPRIVSDIDSALNRLRVNEGMEIAEDGCFAPPEADLAYQTKAALYAVTDPLVTGTVSVTQSVQGGAVAFTDYVAEGLIGAGNFAQALFSKPAPGTFTSISQATAVALALPNITDTIALPTQPTAPSQPSAPKVVSATPDASTGIQQETSVAPIASDVPAPTPSLAPPTTPQITIPSLMPVQPGFGGGGAPAPEPEDVQQSAPTPVAVVVPTAALDVIAPADNAVFGTTTIHANGTADANALVTTTIGSDIATTSADGSGNWSIEISLPEGVSAIAFAAEDDAGLASATIARVVTIDTIAPDASALAIQECALSIVVGMCALPVASATLSWSAVSDAVTYGVVKDGIELEKTDSLTSVQSIAVGATTTFSVVAYDAAGNVATSTPLDLTAIQHPIIINEIAWPGIYGDPSRQWIELKNLTAYTLDLSHLTIARTGGAPMVLSGTIDSSQYPFMVFGTLADPEIGPDTIIVAFEPLSQTSAEQLQIMWNDAVLDSTPEVTTCASWCAGGIHVQLGSNVTGTEDLYASPTMERVSDTADGLLGTSWRINDSYRGYLEGTPWKENSSGLPESGVYCDSESNLMVAHEGFNPFNKVCAYLTQFITRADIVGRVVGIFRGTVGNSTSLPGVSAQGAMIVAYSFRAPEDVSAGEDFFVAIWEQRKWAATNDSAHFLSFFTDGSDTAPHGNYVVIPFTYAP